MDMDGVDPPPTGKEPSQQPSPVKISPVKMTVAASTTVTAVPKAVTSPVAMDMSEEEEEEQQPQKKLNGSLPLPTPLVPNPNGPPGAQPPASRPTGVS